MSDPEDPAPASHDPTPTRPLGPPPPGRTKTDSTLDFDTQPIPQGQGVGRFVVRDVLGSGGMGTVFSAYDPMLDREVALKLLHPELAARAERRLLREAKAMAKLSHPHIVRVYEAGMIDERAFIVMELVRGRDLSRWQSQARDWRECVGVYLQAGRGLAAAHAQGLVHRDFKPSNCIIDDQGGVHVVDFGLARTIGTSHRNGSDSMSLDGDPMPGRPRGVHGTLGYMPLEQIWGQRVDAKSDQFSFCVSLFEAVYGQRPFSGATMDEVVAAMTDGQVDLPATAGQAPRRLWRALVRGMQARPRRRWSSMEQLLRELERLLSRRRRRWQWGSLGLGIGVVALGFGWRLSDPPCDGSRVDGVAAWGDVQREQARRALVQAQEPLDAIEYLDAYAEHWARADQALCEARREAGVEDAETLAIQRRCLAEARDALREAGELLAISEPALVPVAARQVDRVPALSRCEDPQRFASLRPLPADAAQAERVHALRLQQRHAALLQEVGRGQEGVALLEPGLSEARGLGYRPLLAEFELQLGQLLHHAGHYERATQHLEQAYLDATEHDHPSVALSAASTLVYVVGDLLDRHDAGLKWGLTAEGLARQPWVDDMRRVGVRERVANIYYEQGRFSLALERYQQALDSRERTDPEGLFTTLTLANIGLMRLEQGQYEQALPVLEDVLERRLARLGPASEGVAHAQLNLGSVLRGLGRPEEALALYHQALDTYEQLHHDRHPSLVAVLSEMGHLWRDEGQLVRASAAYQRALAIAVKTLGPDHSHTAELWLGLGQVVAAHGQLDAARRHLDKGRRILEQALGPRHVYTGRALSILGRLEATRGSRAEARGHLELAVEILAAGEGPPRGLARARFELARVLDTFSGEHEAARAVAREARQGYAAQGESARAELEAIDAWLREGSSGEPTR